MCVGVILAINASSVPNTSAPPITQATAPSLSLQEALAQEISDDRLELIARLGWPDSFTISILNVDGTEVRCETWRYNQFGTRVDFVDGEIAWTMEIEKAPAGTIFPAWYYPLDFESGMSATDAARMAEISAPSGQKPVSIDLSSAGQDLQGGVVIAGDQILLGIQADHLVYVETLALYPEESE